MAEPLLHCPDVNPRPEPAGRGGIVEAVEMPFGRIEFGQLCDLFAAIVEKAVVEMALGGWKNQRAIGHLGVLPQDLRYFF